MAKQLGIKGRTMHRYFRNESPVPESIEKLAKIYAGGIVGKRLYYRDKTEEEIKELVGFNKSRTLLLINSSPEYVVYWHHFESHNDPFNEGYIGTAIVSKYGSRFAGGLLTNYKRSLYFYNIINKHGELNIHTDILKDGLTIEEANEIELHYRPLPSIGWNIRQGGGNKGFHSEETKRKVSESKTGTNHLYYDKIFTPESREKIRLSKIGNKNMSGKKHSDETKNKMSLSNKGISEDLTLKKLYVSKLKKFLIHS